MSSRKNPKKIWSLKHGIPPTSDRPYWKYIPEVKETKKERFIKCQKN